MWEAVKQQRAQVALLCLVIYSARQVIRVVIVQRNIIMVIIQVARSENWTENRWLNELNNYIEYGNDKDIIRRLKRLYNNLVNV